MEAELGLSRLFADRGCFADAEEILLQAWKRRTGDGDDQARATIRGLVAVYEAWERVEPGLGHSARADAWRAPLAPVGPR